MNTADYQIRVDTDLSARDAFARINAVSDWWTKSFSGRSERRGDTFSVRFGDTFVDFEVVDVLPETKMVWRVTRSSLPWLKNKDEWTGTQVVWDALQHAGKTRVVMTHVGLEPQVECFERCEAGWNFFVGESLPLLLAGGAGMPDRQLR